MDVLQKPASPVLSQDQMERQFSDDLMRMLLHLKYAEMEAGYFRQTPLLKHNYEVHPLARFSREVFSKLKETTHKLSWFIGVVKKILPGSAELLEQELDPDGHKIANVAQLTGWVATSKRDLTDEIDLMVNNTRRKELLWKAWLGGAMAADHHGYEDPQIKEEFNAWYNIRYPA